MPKIPFRTVDDYLAAQPDAARELLKRVRDAIRTAIPQAEESISYNLPTYKLGKRPVLYFAGWKRHYSVYPATDPLIAALRDELAPYDIEKGTIRFPLADPVPTALIGRIAKFRVKEVAG